MSPILVVSASTTAALAGLRLARILRRRRVIKARLADIKTFHQIAFHGHRIS